ncbi:unnamed protein product [Onchocerca ochengi]|uniref:Homeobox domain-containing protein n=1 Tax=Onchocerca ochengi TaxID=42157 RepID=A0A182E243_ONCOC|nr:unnamed protein product [Onchocerca ochengi]
MVLSLASYVSLAYGSVMFMQIVLRQQCQAQLYQTQLYIIIGQFVSCQVRAQAQPTTFMSSFSSSSSSSTLPVISPYLLSLLQQASLWPPILIPTPARKSTKKYKCIDKSLESVRIQTGFNKPQKKKKARTTFTGRQIFELEKQFETKKYLSSSERGELAKLLNVTETQRSTGQRIEKCGVCDVLSHFSIKLSTDYLELLALVGTPKSSIDFSVELQFFDTYPDGFYKSLKHKVYKFDYNILQVS